MKIKETLLTLGLGASIFYIGDAFYKDAVESNASIQEVINLVDKKGVESIDTLKIKNEEIIMVNLKKKIQTMANLDIVKLSNYGNVIIREKHTSVGDDKCMIAVHGDLTIYVDLATAKIELKNDVININSMAYLDDYKYHKNMMYDDSYFCKDINTDEMEQAILTNLIDKKQDYLLKIAKQSTSTAEKSLSSIAMRDVKINIDSLDISRCRYLQVSEK